MPSVVLNPFVTHIVSTGTLYSAFENIGGRAYCGCDGPCDKGGQGVRLDVILELKTSEEILFCQGVPVTLLLIHILHHPRSRQNVRCNLSNI